MSEPVRLRLFGWPCWREIGVLITAVFIGGCGLFSSKDPRFLPAPLVQFKSTVDLKPVWTASVAKSAAFVFTPAVVGNRVYAAGANGELTAFDLANGRQLWRVDVGDFVSGGVGANSDLVLIGTQKGELAAFDQAGKRLWKTQLGAEILAPANITGNTVIVRTADGRLVALNAADGKRKWNYQRVTPTLALRSFAAATVTRGAVFAGFPSGVISAFELETGRVGWESVIATPRGSTELERIADVTSSPELDDSQVCAAAYQGRVSCLELNTGKSIWSREMSSSSGIEVDEKYVYVSEDAGAVVALDKKTGSSVWKQDKLANRRLGKPIATDNVVLVGDGFGYIHALSKEDGSFVGRLDTDGSAIVAPPQSADNLVLFQTRKGGIYAIRPR